MLSQKKERQTTSTLAIDDINAVTKCTLAELYYAVQQLHALAYKCTHSILNA